MISRYSNSSASKSATRIDKVVKVSSAYVYDNTLSLGTRPTIYLSSSVVLSSGIGTLEDPIHIK